MKHDNVIKYQQFCQFKAEVRGSGEYLIVGIDVAKDRHHAFFATATGRTLLKRLVFDNNRVGFEQLVELDKFDPGAGATVGAGFQPCHC